MSGISSFFEGLTHTMKVNLGQIGKVIQKNKNLPQLNILFDYATSFIDSFNRLEINIEPDLSLNKFLEKLEKSLTELPTITVAIMVKNQEKRILSTINSAFNIADNIYIMDTGSTDKTIDIIRDIDNPKISLVESSWVEDYSFMRNKMIEGIKSPWIFILDSDEIISSSVESYKLKLLLSFLDVIFPISNVRIRVNVMYPHTSKFVTADRLLKKTDSIHYVGLVHEEPVSTNGTPLVTLLCNMQLVNHGNDVSEVKRFNKETRYSQLLIEMHQKEPDNPRWIALSSLDLITKMYDRQDLDNILMKYIKVDDTKALSIENLATHEYVRIILEKCIVFYIQSERYSEVERLLILCRYKYPNNINFIFYKYFQKLEKIDMQIQDILNELISETNLVSMDRLEIDSQKDDSLLQAITIKLLFKIGRYDDAKRYLNELSDTFSRSIIRDEIRLLTAYVE